MEIVGLVRVLTNVCALRRQKQLGRAPMIVNVVVIVEVDSVARQKGIQKVVLRVTVRRMGIVEHVEQVIIYLLTNVTSVHLEKPVHRDQPRLLLAKLLKNQMAVHVHQTVNVRPVHAVVQIVATLKDSQPGVPIVIRMAIAIRALLIIIDQVINVMHAVVVKPVHRDQPRLPLAKLL